MPMKNPAHPGRIIRQEYFEPLEVSIAEAARQQQARSRLKIQRYANRRLSPGSLKQGRCTKGKLCNTPTRPSGKFAKVNGVKRDRRQSLR